MGAPAGWARPGAPRSGPARGGPDEGAGEAAGRRRGAGRPVALFCFFPGAMVLSLAYSEALMLALAIGCLLALLKERWVTAGVLGAFATATRPNAVALVAACAWAAGTAIWRRRQWRAL